jgi:hypothetical protein
MKNREHDRIRTLLQQALPPVGESPQPAHDLWPDLKRRINETPAPVRLAVPWFDWALAGGVALVAVAFPASIPVLLYYL